MFLMSVVSVFAQVQIKAEHQKFKSDELSTEFTKKSLLNLKRGTPETFVFYPMTVPNTAIVGFIESGGGIWKPYVNFLYPDSTASIVTGTGKFNVFQHLVGNVFDPRDSNISIFQSPGAPSFSKFTKYTVDSLGVRVGYHRHLDSAVINSVMTEVVDTLEFQFFNINQLTYTTYKNSGFESFAYPVKASFNLAGLRSNNAAGTYKLPLSKAEATRDSTTGWVTTFFQIPVGVTINPNGGLNSSFGYTMVFRPMVQAADGDTLFHQDSDNDLVVNKNNYLSYYFAQNEDVYANQVRQYTAVNNSFFTPKTLRYGQTVNTNGWTTFIPGNAYFEHQNIFAYYQVTTENLAVKNTSKDVKVMSAYPNPAKENSEVVLTLNSTKSADAVITLTDISGKVIKTISAELVDGKNSITISTDALSKGMYLINVSGVDFTSSTKLVVE